MGRAGARRAAWPPPLLCCPATRVRPRYPGRGGRNAIFCNQPHNGSSFLRASEQYVRGAAPLRPHSSPVEAETEFNYVRLSRISQHHKHFIVAPRWRPGGRHPLQQVAEDGVEGRDLFIENFAQNVSLLDDARLGRAGRRDSVS